MSKAKRRLFNIKTEEVSLVDLAANNKKFFIIKRGGTEMPGTNEGDLGKIEEALNTLGSKFDDVITSITKSQEGDEEALIEKAGAKFSKDTLSALKSIHDRIGKLLNIAGNEVTDSEKTEKQVTPEQAKASIMKGIKETLVKAETADKEVDVEAVENIVTNVLKSLNISAESDN